MLAALRSRASARIHTWFGLWHYSAGRLGEAARHFARALLVSERGGHAFAAHLHLGRIFLRIGELARGQDELRRARFENAARFERECRTEEALLDALLRLEAQNSRHDRPGTGRRVRVVTLRRRDDFTSSAERARFQSLPAIRPDEIDDVDWEALAALLAD